MPSAAEQPFSVRSQEPIAEKLSNLESQIQEVHDNNYVLIHAVDDCEKDVKVLKVQMSRLMPSSRHQPPFIPSTSTLPLNQPP